MSTPEDDIRELIGGAKHELANASDVDERKDIRQHIRRLKENLGKAIASAATTSTAAAAAGNNFKYKLHSNL